ncbi:DUF3891 family protein [Salibacterium halotolerans]|uniref:DUF3891 domain-containing protein n=1 Tax=Salibacterium halotolerans TaxID=1884432 RepID=A0A1I5QAR7_9BACI|nr:DUF3891 family protein [Salibacterium halotolerans]SFP43333.1 Protein of unknown function [Salibacterium halotolerans]
MIINEEETFFECIPQHEHARISAEIITLWGGRAAKEDPYWDELAAAVREHDRAWIPLDAAPLADERNRPYDFTNYPEKPKTEAYQRGILEAAGIHRYCGLLVSRHYTSFFEKGLTATGRMFRDQEKERQKKWRRELQEPDNEEHHLALLQFCDDLSLYLCTNAPGASKEEENPWFKNGFRQHFAFVNHETIYAEFSGKEHVFITPFPLQEPLDITIHGRQVLKEELQEKRFSEAFQHSTALTRQFYLHPG